MKKVFSLIGIGLILVSSILIYSFSPKHPFKDLTEGNISSVTVEYKPPLQSIEIEEFDELISMLKDVTIYTRRSSNEFLIGQFNTITITLTDGDVHKITPTGSYIEINGKRYNSDCKVNEKIDKYLNHIFFGISPYDALMLVKEKFKDDKYLDFDRYEIQNFEFKDTPHIFLYDENADIIGKKLYKITIKEKENSMLGPLVAYVDIEDEKIVGFNLRN